MGVFMCLGIRLVVARHVPKHSAVSAREREPWHGVPAESVQNEQRRRPAGRAMGHARRPTQRQTRQVSTKLSAPSKECGDAVSYTHLITALILVCVFT